MHRNCRLRISAFTLIELIVVISIIAILGSLILAGVNAALISAKKDQTQARVQELFLGITMIDLQRSYLPEPDGQARLAYDADLDVTDTANAPTFRTWPLLNKLHLIADLPIDRSLLRADQGMQVITDAWQQPIRYVLSDTADDNGHVAQGARDGWNYRASDSAVIRNRFPYVWSYGEGNEDGSLTDQWICALAED